MSKLVNIFKTPAPDGSYDDAARREAYAQALRERAMRQRGPAPGGPVQAQYGIGEGLTQLAEALLARRAGKSAIDAKKMADTQQTQQNDATIGEMLPATQMQARRADPETGQLGQSVGRVENMQSDALSMALRGQDPQAIGKFLAERKLAALMPDPADVADRELKMYQVGATMADKEQARAEQMQRLQMQIASDERAGRDSNALRAQLAQMQADSRIQAAEIAAAASRDSAATRQGVKADAADEKKQGRLAGLEAARGALARIQATSDTLGGGGGFIEGRIPAVGPVAQDFDGAKAQLLATIQNALRTPGTGAQSNMELQALMAALPERTQEQEVRNNQIKGIADRLNIIIERQSGGGMQPAAPAGAAPAAGGGLSPQEEAELAELRKRFGK